MYFSTSEVIGGDSEVESKNGFHDGNNRPLYIISVKFDWFCSSSFRGVDWQTDFFKTTYAFILI